MMLLPFVFGCSGAAAPAPMGRFVVAPSPQAEAVTRDLTRSDVLGFWLHDVTDGTLLVAEGGHTHDYDRSISVLRPWSLDGAAFVTPSLWDDVPTRGYLREDGALVHDGNVYWRAKVVDSFVGRWITEDTFDDYAFRDELTLRADGSGSHDWWHGPPPLTDVATAREHHLETGTWAALPCPDPLLPEHVALRFVVDGVPSTSDERLVGPLDGSDCAVAPAVPGERRLYLKKRGWALVPEEPR